MVSGEKARTASVFYPDGHAVHLVIWDIAPSPVICGETMTVKVGAKCACGCKLAGESISIRDDNGVQLISAQLLQEPSPGTAGLFWTLLKIPVPPRTGTQSWSANFVAQEAPVVHHEASARFIFTTENPPEHLVTVKVKESDTMAPLAAAEVRLGAFRAITDEKGIVCISMPTGTFDAWAWKAGYNSPVDSIDINSDGSITLLISEIPHEDPHEQWC